jgi:hypothetical protein
VQLAHAFVLSLEGTFDFLSKTVLSNFCSELDFDVSSSTAIDPTTKHVKFLAGLTDERTAVSSLDGPVVSFGKIIVIPKLKDLSKMPEPEGVFDKFIRSTSFTKHIVPLHNAYTNSKDPPTNRSQESNGDQMTGALRSCQSHLTECGHMDLTFLRRTMRHITKLVRVLSLPENGLGREDLVQLAATIADEQFCDAHSSISALDDDESVRQCLRVSCLVVLRGRRPKLDERRAEQHC